MTDPRIFKATRLAAILHEKQRRKDGSPYIHHPYSVALIVRNYTDEVDTLIAAIMHDIVEDVPKEIYSEEQLIKDFGENVFRIISDVSDRHEPTSKEEEIRTWKERRVKYLKHMETVGLDSLLVAIADKIHNHINLITGLEDEGDSFWEKFHASKEDELWYHKSFAEIVKTRLPGEAANELHHYFEIVSKLSENGS